MNPFLRRFQIIISSCFIILSLISCGYRLVGSASSLPQNIKKIFIPVFINSSREPGIENSLTHRVRQEFIKDGRLKVVDASEADMIIIGEVTDYFLKPVAFDSSDVAVEYWVVFQVKIKAEKKNGSGSPILNRLLKTKWDYSVSSDLVSSEDARLAAIKSAEKNFSQQLVAIVIEGF